MDRRTEARLDGETRAAVADALEARSEAMTDEILARIADGVPDLVADASLRTATRDIVRGLGEALVALVRAGDVGAPGIPEPPVRQYAERIADLGLPSDRLTQVFRGGQRLFLAELMRILVDVLPPDRLEAQLPVLLAGALEVTDAGQAEATRTYAEALESRARRDSAGVTARLRWVLDEGVDDVDRASSLLGHPVGGRNVAVVLRARDEAAHRDAHRALRGLARGRDVLTVAQDDGTALVWAAVDGAVDVAQWCDALEDLGSVRAAVGEPGEGLGGFRRSHSQAREAFRVASLSDAGPRVAAYARVASLAFVATSPALARGWVRWTLGDLAAPGAATERLRSTLRAYLAAGENPGEVAESMFVHRNTIAYRVGRADDLLPHGLDGHRVDVALALELLVWFPEALDGERAG